MQTFPKKHNESRKNSMHHLIAEVTPLNKHCSTFVISYTNNITDKCKKLSDKFGMGRLFIVIIYNSIDMHQLVNIRQMNVWWCIQFTETWHRVRSLHDIQRERSKAWEVEFPHKSLALNFGAPINQVVSHCRWQQVFKKISLNNLDTHNAVKMYKYMHRKNTF